MARGAAPDCPGLAAFAGAASVRNRSSARAAGMGLLATAGNRLHPAWSVRCVRGNLMNHTLRPLNQGRCLNLIQQITIWLRRMN